MDGLFEIWSVLKECLGSILKYGMFEISMVCSKFESYGALRRFYDFEYKLKI
jgi:hypothetical protein